MATNRITKLLQRYPGTRLVARAICTLPSGEKRSLYATHLSLADAFILSMRPLPIGSTLTVVFYPDGQHPIPPLECRVVGLRIDPASAERSGFEVIFTQVDDELLDLLSRVLSTLSDIDDPEELPSMAKISPRNVKRSRRAQYPALGSRQVVPEQRVQPRVATSLEASVHLPEGSLPVNLLNLSMSGALLGLGNQGRPSSIRPGVEVDLTIKDPIAPECVCVRAEVVRLTCAGEPTGFAVRFLEVDEVIAGRIEEILVRVVRYAIERKQAQAEREKLEEQLRQSHKLEAVGRLAGGVAHDFNNMMTVVLMSCQFLEADGAVGPGSAEFVADIRKAAQGAADLTRQLLAFSREQVLQPRVLDLNAVVAGMDKMLRRLIGEDIELVTVLARDPWPVKADPGQIEQVLVNLAVNARGAMPLGGKLTLETGKVELDEKYARRHHGVAAGEHVLLAVSDTGCGMDAQTLSQIFEPFFTTKEAGKGTGLGLSTVYGIIKQSGGNIWVYSEPGQGTTFKIYLPRATGAQVEAAAPAPRPEARGNETVLVVEDDDAMRKVIARTLGASGYRVLAAARGEEALALLAQHRDPIDLLLTDVVMPGMSGRVLAERLAQSRPEMRVLYMSGYTDNAIVHHGVLEPGVLFLQKPFTADALTSKVREVVGGSTRPARAGAIKSSQEAGEKRAG